MASGCGNDSTARSMLSSRRRWMVGCGDRLVKLVMSPTAVLARFHPGYQFAGTAVGDITNFTNRSPHPTIHLLREESIERAVESFPQPEAIYETNMKTLREIGPEGWAALDVGRSS